MRLIASVLVAGALCFGASQFIVHEVNSSFDHAPTIVVGHTPGVRNPHDTRVVRSWVAGCKQIAGQRVCRTCTTFVQHGHRWTICENSYT